MLQSCREKIAPWAVLILRVYVGLVMALHGWSKIQNIPGTIEGLGNMGLPSPEYLVYLAIAGEFLGGLGLLVGFLTPIAAFGVFCTMAVAVFKIHWANGLMASSGGFEYPMTLLWVALFFMAHGSGKYGVDAMCCNKCCGGGSCGSSAS